MSNPANMAEADVIKGVQIFKLGENVVHPNGDFTVDKKFVTELMSSWNAITDSGYRPPVLAEHGRAEDGRIYGKVLRLYSDADGVNVDLELAAGVKEEWDKGMRGPVSPSIWKEFTHPHTGEELKTVLREVSMVSVPHLKNLKSVPGHYSLSESGFIESGHPTNAQEADMPEGNEEEEMEMSDMVAALAERVGALEAMMEKPPEDMAEDEEEDEETSMAERRIADLEYRLAMSEVQRDIPAATGDDLKELAAIKVMSETQYEKVRKLRTSADFAERGVTGAATAGAVDFSVAKQRARKAGCAPGYETMAWISKNHPSAL